MMMRLGLRLTLRSGREAMVRLVAVAIAVAIGGAMLLSTLAAVNAVRSQNARYAWLATTSIPGPDRAGVDALWGEVSDDYYTGQRIFRVDVAPTGRSAPIPPGIPRLPQPGQIYVSPALDRLIKAVPPEQLQDRYGATIVGVIGESALPSPNALVVVVGRTVASLSQDPHAAKVSVINTTPPDQCGGCAPGIGLNPAAFDLILGVVGVALLLPVLVFIGSATRLSAGRREQRFAAMRLVGATPRQISVIAAIESTVATGLGVALGFALFAAIRPLIAGITFTDLPFYQSDLSLSLTDVIVVVVGLPVAAGVAARIALRRVMISPLGVSRRVTPPAPRAVRLTPLLLGLGWLLYLVIAGPPDSGPAQVLVFMIGFFLLIVGLVLGGAWLVVRGALKVLDLASGPAALLAGRRLADDPRRGFRAISGVVLALFVGTVAVLTVTTDSAHHSVASAGPAGNATLLTDVSRAPAPGQPASNIPLSDAALSALRQTPGVTAATVLRVEPNLPPESDPIGLVDCAAIARIPGMGRCVSGATVGAVDQIGDSGVWPRASYSLAQLSTLPVSAIAVGTNGSTAAIEQARTLLEQADPQRDPPNTLNELDAIYAQQVLQFKKLADVIILISLPIAGFSLAVGVIAGLDERRRPFSLLRLTGVPLRLLRRVVLLESALPLLIAAAMAIAVGVIAAQLFATAQLHVALSSPGSGYVLAMVASIVLSLGLVASALPLVARTTSPELVRND